MWFCRPCAVLVGVTGWMYGVRRRTEESSAVAGDVCLRRDGSTSALALASEHHHVLQYPADGHGLRERQLQLLPGGKGEGNDVGHCPVGRAGEVECAAHV